MSSQHDRLRDAAGILGPGLAEDRQDRIEAAALKAIARIEKAWLIAAEKTERSIVNGAAARGARQGQR